MKIDRRDITGLSGAQRPGLARPGTRVQRSAESSGVQPPDQLSLSDRTVQVSELQPALAALPAVRADLVARLKEQIARGEYRVDPHRLAGRLLQAGVIDE
ncbi:flagellar biosynthesis anti-sigma factor FlgM [Symbiobacterium terraclitae]|uniref:flagellar biosynthesis anti-sigma factor FlgM n=1 Tax=Symbiobacterium terraclitae TaxID=557451 RepID=UPI0035B4FD52